MELLPININDTVLVKLTDLGYKKLTERHNELAIMAPTLGIKTPEDYKAKADKGYTRFQIWELMETFGSLIGICQPNYFETTILLEKK
ncbi:hypothetical protein ACLOAU_14520 [Niabella sp. CJ426]|uniref:hypothetical protein n=1 Tax=Niabella sp. CJ426 TaxID=3393740 RepID=UPI003CFE68DC